MHGRRRGAPSKPTGRGSAIHRGLVGARELVGKPYLADEALRREYERDIAPRTRAALGKILVEVFPPDALQPDRALDLGTGTGAAAEALRAHFGDSLDVVRVDWVSSPGVVRADLSVALPPVEGRFDLIVAAHLLGELYVDRPPEERIDARAQRIQAWEALLVPGGTIIVVEPALRETSRELLAVRDQLLALSDLNIVAPCFWTGPCPALDRERDWCHDAAPVPSAPRVDFSYLVLRDRWKPLPGQLSYRIVSDPMPEKGRLKVYACGPTGRDAHVRLDRNASPSNAAFAELVRGDVARIAGAVEATDGMRVEAATAVALRSPRPAKRGEG
jgi:Mitochondrial small ribosomal subunit Rsm22